MRYARLVVCWAAAAGLVSCHATPAPEQLKTASLACSGSHLEWTTVLHDCACSRLQKADPLAHRDCGVEQEPLAFFAFNALRGSVSAAASAVAAGATLPITIRYTNVSGSAVRLTLRGPAGVMVYDESRGEKLVDVDDPSRLSTGEPKCERTEVGEVALNLDPSEIWLAPGGTLTETLTWHAARAMRDRATCGWNYEPLTPGRYRLWVYWPEGNAQIGMVLVTVTKRSP